MNHERANCWVWLRDLGWRKIDDRNEESCTEMFRIAVEAKRLGATISMHEELRGDRWVITEIQDFPTASIGPAQEVTFSVSECTFGWTAAYHQRGTQLTVRIRLVPDTGITEATMAALRNTWKTGIESKWGNRFGCCTNPGCVGRCRLQFDVQWVTSNEHHTVRVRPGPAQSNKSTWDTSDDGHAASHEFGHMLGHPDEYSSAACPSRNPVNTNTVMDSNSDPVVERLCRPFCDRLGQSTFTA